MGIPGGNVTQGKDSLKETFLTSECVFRVPSLLGGPCALLLCTHLSLPLAVDRGTDAKVSWIRTHVVKNCLFFFNKAKMNTY